jgi:nucleoside-diphosphate-sugar epimerase
MTDGCATSAVGLRDHKVTGTSSHDERSVVETDDLILVTGANGFIGARVVEGLLAQGYRHIRCLVRTEGNKTKRLRSIIARHSTAPLEVVAGNLTSTDDCSAAARDVRVVFHLAAGIAEKSPAACYLNTVVSTRNLLDALCQAGSLKRFVNVGSLAVYSNFNLPRGAVLDEQCPVETDYVSRGEPYAHAKLQQDQLVMEYASKHEWSYVILRPGAVYGPGKSDITGRIGIRVGGFFLHLGGRNRIPFTHVRNCAEAIILAGTTATTDRQVFNVIDDELPTGKDFIAAYRRYVGPLRCLSVPYPVFYGLCSVWERCARWSGGHRAVSRRRCAAYWKGNRYSNRKLKEATAWMPLVSFADAAPEYFDYLRHNKSSQS